MARVNPYDSEAIERAQAAAARLAAEVLAGRRTLVGAAPDLHAYLAEAGVPRDDPALDAFVLISSETDGLPIGEVRRYWDPATLAQKNAEVARAEAWARAFGLAACETVVRRFAPGAQP